MGSGRCGARSESSRNCCSTEVFRVVPLHQGLTPSANHLRSSDLSWASGGYAGLIVGRHLALVRRVALPWSTNAASEPAPQEEARYATGWHHH